MPANRAQKRGGSSALAAAADEPIAYKPSPSGLESVPVHVGPIAPALRVVSTKASAAPEQLEAERLVLAPSQNGSNLGEIMATCLAETTEPPAFLGEFLEGVEAELEVLRLALIGSEHVPCDLEHLANVLGAIRRRSSAARAIHQRMERATAIESSRSALALPDPEHVVDALLALPGVVRPGAGPLETLQRLLRALGVAVFRRDEQEILELRNEHGSRVTRDWLFSPPWRRSDDGQIVALVPHDATAEERLEHWPRFVVAGLIVREAYGPVPFTWRSGVIDALCRRLEIGNTLQEKRTA